MATCNLCGMNFVTEHPCLGDRQQVVDALVQNLQRQPRIAAPVAISVASLSSGQPPPAPPPRAAPKPGAPRTWVLSQANPVTLWDYRNKANSGRLRDAINASGSTHGGKLMSALAKHESHSPYGARPGPWKDLSLEAFLSGSLDLQLKIIDFIWAEVIVVEPYSTPVREMVDPASAFTSGSFTGAASWLQPFKFHGYCFRCDTRAADEIKTQGFKPSYSLPGRVPADIQGTLLHRLVDNTFGKIYGVMWVDHRDAISDATVCASRTLRGSAKFPGPNDSTVACISAIKIPLDTEGFDTEAWQEGLGGTALWRPGEKAFSEIKPEWVIASINITKWPVTSTRTTFEAAQRIPEGDQSYFTFWFTDPDWTVHPEATETDKQFLQVALAEVHPGVRELIHVLKKEDFYNPDYFRR
jgi:hypothetical protein